jgi:hypothetical protein
MKYLIRDIIYSSIKNLFANQTEIFMNTSQTNLTEWNLSYHFANELFKYIFWLDVDLDVTKRNYSNRRPDIIFHRRQINALNFLVVELKKNRNDCESDIIKIKDDWMNEPLNYRYGAYINIWDIKQYKAIFFDEKNNQYEINDSCNYISIPNLDTKEKIKLKRYVDKIKLMSVINQSEATNMITLLEHEIMNLYRKVLLL